MSEWPELVTPQYNNWISRLWNYGKNPIPYPRLKGESKKEWWHRIYPQLCETIYKDDELMGEEVAAYLYGYTILNVFVRAGISAAVGVVILFVVCGLIKQKESKYGVCLRNKELLEAASDRLSGRPHLRGGLSCPPQNPISHLLPPGH